MQELHSETPLKRENPPQKNEKERKSHELEANCMGIATDDAALEKHEEKKRRKMKEIKVSEVVGLESSDEPESKEEKKKKRKREKSHKHENKEKKSQEIEVISMEIGSGVTSQEAEASSEKYDKKKTEIEADKDSVVVSREASDKPESKIEKKKRKREKSHKHDKPEYSGVPSHEGFVEPEIKAGKKKKRNREKTGKHEKSEKKSQNIEVYSTQEAKAASEKHDRKKRKKNKEIDVDKDIEVVSQESFAEGSTKDKKRKKEKNEEEIDISSKEQQLSAEDKLQNKKQEKGKEVVACGLESSRENVTRKERSFDDAETSKEKKPTQKKPRKSVSFSGNVEVFPLGNDADAEADADDNTEKPLVQGKRFTKEEDELLKNAVQKYIEGNQLGNEGLHMVLNCSKYPQARNCWRDIGLSIPWRPLEAVYYRAHVLFERSEARKWEPHEYDTLLRLHKLHGKNWKVIGEELGKHRFQVKDTWRRIENQNRRYGRWSQEEYQALFDLVNLDMTMKAYDEKKTKHGMLKDNISWKAIGKKLSTRNFQSCCTKWYYQLASPLVKEGHWYNSDDYRLLDALEKQDACCVEDVDWDNLLRHRSGEYCQRRWSQMVRYIGGYREKPFIEQVEVLCNRYCPEMLKYRNDEEALASGSSLHKETENGEKVKAP